MYVVCILSRVCILCILTKHVCILAGMRTSILIAISIVCVENIMITELEHAKHSSLITPTRV